MGVTLSATRLPFLQVLSSPFKDLRTLSAAWTLCFIDGPIAEMALLQQCVSLHYYACCSVPRGELLQGSCCHHATGLYRNSRPRLAVTFISREHSQRPSSAIGAYVVSIQSRSLFFSVPCFHRCFRRSSAAGDQIRFFLTAESRSDSVDFRRPSLHLQLSQQLKRIHALRTVSGRGGFYVWAERIRRTEDSSSDAARHHQPDHPS
jgi:hypothetical protein